MPGRFTIQMIDYDRDTRQFSVPITETSAANHDTLKGTVIALQLAIADISHCNIPFYDFVADRQVVSPVPPSVAAAQVNIQWKVTYVDDTTAAVETVRIPGADLTLTDVLLPASNVVDLAQTEMAAFVAAFEAVVLSDAGNTVTIQQIEFLE